VFSSATRSRFTVSYVAGLRLTVRLGVGAHYETNPGACDVAAVCDICGKGPGFGMSVSHSHRRTHRRWNPNIQTVRKAVSAGRRQRLNVCTSCIKAGKITRA
jgi:large subunit ribosomal protein L28